MRILITAGPTREHIDSVRFITNASSGKMGYAVAAAARAAGHEVTLLAGPVALMPPPGCKVVPFVSVEELRRAMEQYFPACDALVMTAAVGDFRPQSVIAGKIHRADGPITIRLVPTEDVLAAVAKTRRPGQRIVGFAVEEGAEAQIEAKARSEMTAKGSDFTVANTPAAMAADDSLACILSRDAILVPWARRKKEELAKEIVRLLTR